MDTLWIRLLVMAHQWTGKQLRRARLKRLLSVVESELRRRGEELRRN